MVFEYRDEWGKLFCRSEYLPEIQCIYNEWRGNLTFEQLREAGEAGLKGMGNRPLLGMINDNRKIESPWSEDFYHYIYRVWLPRAVRGGFRRMAQITDESTEMFSRYSTRFFAEDNPTEAEIRVFEDFESARAWIAEIAPGD